MLSSSTAFTGTRATYIALSAVTTLGLALLTSLWHSDVSGSTALLGLIAIYMGSSELLLLYVVFSPASVIVDIIRLSITNHAEHGGGHGWLIFFTVIEMLCKIIGTIFAWSLHKSVTSGEGMYEAVSTNQHLQQPASQGAYHAGDNPFSTYAPPPANNSSSTPGAVPQTYQPFPTSQAAAVDNL